MDSEVNFVRTLVEGEEALDAQPMSVLAGESGASSTVTSSLAAPSPGPAGPAGAEAYEPPSPIDFEFNSLLQFLVQQEPPNLDTNVNTPVTLQTPVRIGALLA